MSVLNENQLIGASAGGDYEIEQSLRFDDGRGTHLERTPTVAGNRKTWTWSGWVKLGNIGVSNIMFDAYRGNGSAVRGAINVNNENEFEVVCVDNSSVVYRLKTSALLRDSSAWYHLLVAFDTTQSTSSNRVKMYINGTRVTSFGTEVYPNQNTEYQFNNTDPHRIGRNHSTTYSDAYLAEVNFIDGQALTPDSFGSTGKYGQWKPIKYDGTYGTNGFYLTFEQDYSVEGFSTVTYNATEAAQYIGGVGFRPDFLWFKNRNRTTGHRLMDSVRGIPKTLNSDDTSAEATGLSDGTKNRLVTGLNPDGFTLGMDDGGYGINYSNGQNIVAWCWAMGNSHGTRSTISVGSSTQHDTSQYKFGSSSIKIANGGSGTGLTIPQSLDVSPDGTNARTYETWIRITATGDGAALWKGAQSDWFSPNLFLQTNGTIGFGNQDDGGGNLAYIYSSALSVNTWHHVACTVNKKHVRIFINGVLSVEKYYTTGTWNRAGSALEVASKSGTNSTVWVDQIRISNFIRYEYNFSVPTAAFSNDNSTTLLIQSNTTNGSTTFVDTSGADVNTSGTITSNVSANPTYGQSIVTYTGNGSDATVGHGLTQAPDLVITKRRTSTSEYWIVWHSGFCNSDGDWIALQVSQAARINGEVMYDASGFTSSTFGVRGGATGVNVNGATQVSYCFHNVAGYSKFSTYTGNNNTTGPVVELGFSPAFIMIKDITAGNTWVMLDNTRNSSNPNTSLLQPQEPAAETLNYGGVDFNATGFQIKSTENGLNAAREYLYIAFADTREYAYWYDQSGNNNDWASTDLTESDVMVDSPTNNFATLNPLLIRGTTPSTFSEGNLTAVGSSSYSASTIEIPASSKFYTEFYVNLAGTSSANVGLNYGSEIQTSTSTNRVIYAGSNGQIRINSTAVATGATYTTGDIIGVAADTINGTVQFFKNNVSQGTATKDVSDMLIFIIHGGSWKFTINFGQDSSFAGNKTPQGNADSNDIGDFFYPPPTGFLALCTKNLPSVDVIPSENFNTVTYTGNGSSTHAITNVGFTPDWVWAKQRNTTRSHRLLDSVRGAGVYLASDNTNQESSASGLFKTFDSDGFTLDAASALNQSGGTYVAWNWKAGGSSIIQHQRHNHF